jgi:four helix bundle protein
LNQDALKQRTKRFALGIIQLVEAVPKSRSADVLGRQLLRSGTSVGANYRAACRARSVADFISKMGIVEEEVDESIYWLELLQECKLADFDKIKTLTNEASELLAITVASIRTARNNKKTVKSL